MSSYVMLAEALQSEGFLVTEVEEAASVPELLVRNRLQALSSFLSRRPSRVRGES